MEVGGDGGGLYACVCVCVDKGSVYLWVCKGVPVRVRAKGFLEVISFVQGLDVGSLGFGTFRWLCTPGTLTPCVLAAVCLPAVCLPPAPPLNLWLCLVPVTV